MYAAFLLCRPGCQRIGNASQLRDLCPPLILCLLVFVPKYSCSPHIQYTFRSFQYGPKLPTNTDWWETALRVLHQDVSLRDIIVKSVRSPSLFKTTFYTFIFTLFSPFSRSKPPTVILLFSLFIVLNTMGLASARLMPAACSCKKRD